MTNSKKIRRRSLFGERAFVNYQKWILITCWPILMVGGLFFMVNFTFELLGLVGLVMIFFGFVTAAWFIFGTVGDD